MPVNATPTLYSSPTTINPNTGEGLGGLGPNGIVTPEAVRTFMADYPELNVLNDYQIKMTEKSIVSGIMMTCSMFNSIAPLNWTVKLDGSDWPVAYPHMLIQGVASYWLKGEAALQLRNQFNSSDGNMPAIGIHDKYQSYMHFTQTLAQEVRADISRVKVVSDLERATRVSRSPLAYGGFRGY